METSQTFRRQAADNVPLLHGTPVSDDYPPNENNLFQSPDSVIEDWLLLGGRGAKSARTKRSSSSRGSPRGRGRSPTRPIYSPALPLDSSPAPERKSRSLEPRQSSTRLCAKLTPAKDSSSSFVVPIPARYVEHIVTAFGADADLYKDVLGLQQVNCTPAKLRVAFFRRGRQVLQKPRSVTSSVFETTRPVTDKQKFQAVTKAYEILSNPGWKAYYEAYGLTASADENVVAENVEYDEASDDTASVSSGDGFAMLRRSKSWGGPTLCRSTSRGRVCWKEEVEELVYQLDPLNSSTESSGISKISFERQSAARAPLEDISKNCKEKNRFVAGDSLEFNDAHEKQDRYALDMQDNNYQRDFLDDVEAGLDELEAKFGVFVNYTIASTKDGNTAVAAVDAKRRRQEKVKDEDADKSSETDANCDEQLFVIRPPPDQTNVSADIKQPPLADKKYISASRDNTVVTAAKLRNGNADQPRKKTKTKTAKKVKMVEWVPSNIFEPFATDDVVWNKAKDDDRFDEDALMYSKPEVDLFFPTNEKSISLNHFSKRDSTDWSVPKTMKSMTDRWNGPAAAATTTKLVEFANSRSAANVLGCRECSLSSVGASNVTGRETLLDCELHPTEDYITSSEGEVWKTGFDIGAAITMSFDDALIIKTDSQKFRAVVNRKAQTAIPNVSTVHGTKAVATSIATAKQLIGSNDCDAQDRSAIPGGKDNTFLSTLSCYMQTFVNDLSNLSSKISTNVGVANQVVVETLSFPAEEVDGMLQVLQSQLTCLAAPKRTTTV